MSSTLIIILVACGIFLFLVLVAVLIHLSNKRRRNNIDNRIKQYKSEASPVDEKITLSKDITAQTAENLEDDKEKKEALENKEQEHIEPIIEDYINSAEFLGQNENKKKKKSSRSKPYTRQQNTSVRINNNIEDRDKEFEDFLNEHALSRRIVNNEILEKLKDLPPNIKAIILSNVFNKYNDD